MRYTRRESGKETLWWQTLRNWDQTDASEINANEKWKLHIPNRRWNSQTLRRRSGSENIHVNPGQPRPRRRTRKSSRKIRRFFTTTSRLIVVWWWSKKIISGPSQAILFTVITLHRESNCTCREKNLSQFHFDTLDVTRASSTTLDVMLERRIDDTGISKETETFSDSWTGFTRFTTLDEKPPDGYTWSGGGWRRNKRHPGLTTCCQKYGKTWQKQRNETKNNSGVEKQELDNARRMRGIYFIDPADAGFKETV